MRQSSDTLFLFSFVLLFQINIYDFISLHHPPHASMRNTKDLGGDRAERYDKIGTWTLDMSCPIGAWCKLFVPRCTLYMFLSFSSENVRLYWINLSMKWIHSYLLHKWAKSSLWNPCLSLHREFNKHRRLTKSVSYFDQRRRLLSA